MAENLANLGGIFYTSHFLDFFLSDVQNHQNLRYRWFSNGFRPCTIVAIVTIAVFFCHRLEDTRG